MCPIVFYVILSLFMRLTF